jgi:hypothetical protein
MDKPIAWYDPTNGAVSTDKDSPLFTPLGQVLPLYSQGAWIGLTEDERKEIWNVGEKKDQALRAALIQTIRDVETKLKERNT